jgi:hypothetical protein
MLDQLVNLYEAWEKSDKAQEWRSKIPKIEAENE